MSEFFQASQLAIIGSCSKASNSKGLKKINEMKGLLV